MNTNVPLEVVIQAEPRAAYVTGEWFLPSVDEAVSFQSRASPIRPVAHGAYERSYACVFPLMHSQGVSIFESLITHCAFVFFGVGVNHLMEAKGVFTLEVLPARCTAEWSFFRVHRHVTFQLDRRPESLVTKLALQHLLALLVA